jgi:Fis family transcriptional regulator
MGSGRTVSKTTVNGAARADNMSVHDEPLCDLTEQALEAYFATLNGHAPAALYDLVMQEVERPLFRAVMSFTSGNQSQAAAILGINRGTLRKKLKTYELLG